MSGVVDTVRAALESAGDADDGLRAAVAALAATEGVVWAGIAFAEGEDLVPGPAAGEPDPARRHAVPVVFGDTTVGELQVDGEIDLAEVRQIAELAAAHVLLGWDIGGEEWLP